MPRHDRREQEEVDAHVFELEGHLRRVMTALLAAGTPDRAMSPCNLGGRAAQEACCALKTSQAGMGEDLLLLPTLLRATALAPGTFVELGANDGISGSNTLMLERCFNWTGLLVEGNPHTFAKLRRARRRATAIHSSVCPTPGHVKMTGSGMVSANVAAMGPSIRQQYYSGVLSLTHCPEAAENSPQQLTERFMHVHAVCAAGVAGMKAISRAGALRYACLNADRRAV